MVLSQHLSAKLSRVKVKLHERYIAKLALVDDLDFVKRCPAWARRKVATKICRSMVVKTYLKEMTIMDQSLSTFNLYIIVSGEVGCYVGNGPLQKRLKPGDSFGELALTFTRACQTSYVALETTQVYVQSKQDTPSILRDVDRQHWQRTTSSFLRSCSVFSDHDLGSLSYIYYHGIFLNYGKSHIVYSAGQSPEGFYIIIDGEFSTKTVRKKAPNKQSDEDEDDAGGGDDNTDNDSDSNLPAHSQLATEHSVTRLKATLPSRSIISKVRTLGTGAFFGEEELIKNETRKFDVMCESAVGKVFYFSSSVFFHLILSSQVSRNILLKKSAANESLTNKQLTHIESSIQGYQAFLLGKNLEQFKPELSQQNKSKKQKKQLNSLSFYEKTFSGLRTSVYCASEQDIEAKLEAQKRRRIAAYHASIQVATTSKQDLRAQNNDAKQFNQHAFDMETETFGTSSLQSQKRTNANANNQCINNTEFLQFVKKPEPPAQEKKPITPIKSSTVLANQYNELFQMFLQKNTKEYGKHFSRMQSVIADTVRSTKKSKQEYLPRNCFSDSNNGSNPFQLIPKINGFIDKAQATERASNESNTISKAINNPSVSVASFHSQTVELSPPVIGTSPNIKQRIIRKQKESPSPAPASHKILHYASSSLSCFPITMPPNYHLFSASIEDLDTPNTVKIKQISSNHLDNNNKNTSINLSSAIRSSSHAISPLNSQSKLGISPNEQPNQTKKQPAQFFFSKTSQSATPNSRRALYKKSQSISTISQFKGQDISMKSHSEQDDNLKSKEAQTVDQNNPYSDSTSFSAIASAAIGKNIKNLNQMQFPSSRLSKGNIKRQLSQTNTPRLSQSQLNLQLQHQEIASIQQQQVQQSSDSPYQAFAPINIPHSSFSAYVQATPIPSKLSTQSNVPNSTDICSPIHKERPPRISLNLPWSQKTTPRNQLQRMSLDQTPRGQSYNYSSPRALIKAIDSVRHTIQKEDLGYNFTK